MPPQRPDDIRAKVEKYLNDEFAKLGSKCNMKIEYLHGGDPWVADPKHWNYEAAKVATEVRDIPSAPCLVPSFHFPPNLSTAGPVTCLRNSRHRTGRSIRGLPRHRAPVFVMWRA